MPEILEHKRVTVCAQANAREPLFGAVIGACGRCPRGALYLGDRRWCWLVRPSALRLAPGGPAPL